MCPLLHLPGIYLSGIKLTNVVYAVGSMNKVLLRYNLQKIQTFSSLFHHFCFVYRYSTDWNLLIIYFYCGFVLKVQSHSHFTNQDQLLSILRRKSIIFDKKERLLIFNQSTSLKLMAYGYCLYQCMMIYFVTMAHQFHPPLMICFFYIDLHCWN